jgi:hypothetical protein
MFRAMPGAARRLLRRCLVPALVGMTLPLHAAEPKLPQLNLTYDAFWRGFGLGQITVVLKAEGGPDCYRYESSSDPSGLVRMFYGAPHETSRFCVSGGKIVPQRFEFANPKDRDGGFALDFDAKAGKVRDGKGNVRDAPANAQDRFGIQQAVRLWVLAHLQDEPGKDTVEFASVDDTHVRNYRFAITGREEIATPAGRFNTVLVQRVDNPDRSSKFWLAAEKDYMPVRVEQIRKGTPELRMELRGGS